jgi:hypothetical protein
MMPLQIGAVAAAGIGSSHTLAPTHIVQPLVGTASGSAPHAGSHPLGSTDHAGAFAHGDGHAPALASLLNGVAPVAHGPVAHAGPIMASGVSMPSANQLIAAMGGHGQPHTPVAGVDHSQFVSQVLADALHGGEGHGPNIDMLLNTHSGNFNHATHDVIEALASHAGSAVPFSNSGLAGAFHGSHNMFSMNGMAHHDAAPHHG